MPTKTVKDEKDSYDGQPIKSDPRDAILIARLATQGKYVKPIERDDIYQDIYSGYRLYNDKLTELNRIGNKIHVWNDKYFSELEHVYKIDSLAIKAIYDNQLLPEEIANMSDEKFTSLMVENNRYAKKSSIIKVKELASQIDYVEKAVEICGIGYMSMVEIVAETGDLNNYEHAKQVLKMSGLSLKENSSGQKKGKKSISKRGRSILRRNLKQIDIALVGKNSFFMQLHNYYTTQRKQCLTKLISVNAIIRKFVYILMAIVKNKESFNAEKARRESCILSSI